MRATSASRTRTLRKLAATPAPALFAGPRGAGKTKAAQAIADERGVELRRVDLSQLVGSYIGETEKNIDRLFDAAAADGAVLLLDEADAVFGERTEVRDAHDRYANAAVEHLIARLEAHPGLAIVMTRRREALDRAFLRRLRFVVDFPYPGK